MNRSAKQSVVFVLTFFIFAAVVSAQNVNIVGLNLLQMVTTNLNGAGIRVAQPEATVDSSGDYFEVNPVAIGVSTNLLSYISDLGSATNFPNSVGFESGHADAVAQNFYGPPGMATNVAHVDNWFADEFVKISEFTTPTFTNYTVSLPATNINDVIVNQSYILGTVPVSLQQASDSSYDNYAARYKTLFVSGAGNGGQVSPPSTSYNGLSVGVSDGSSSYGPTADNGRCKPDIIAPGGATSFSTPLVSGAAALLMQAGLRGDGGSDTNSAADIRTTKALLLNGAIKPSDWTNVAPAPLDFRYGAGVLNVFNSYEQLIGGKQTFTVSVSVTNGTAHLPPANANSISALSGWDFNTNTSASSGVFSSAMDGVNHYFFNVTNASQTPFMATATLVWNRQQNQSGINNLALFLYNAANSNLVACSTSAVDNVEHIFLPKLSPGRYDLQVWKAGGSFVSASETYAVAWEFVSPTLTLTNAGATLSLAWPIYPAGFVVEATTNLSSPSVWETNDIPPSVTANNLNSISINATNAQEFFHLRRP